MNPGLGLPPAPYGAPLPPLNYGNAPYGRDDRGGPPGPPGRYNDGPPRYAGGGGGGREMSPGELCSLSFPFLAIHSSVYGLSYLVRRLGMRLSLELKPAC